MRVAIVYPPLKSEKGVALLTQNRQFQWFSRPTYIFPVVPATAATMLKKAGHEVLFLDGIAAELTEDEFERRLAAFRPDLVVLETKTPVVKRHWQWIRTHASLSRRVEESSSQRREAAEAQSERKDFSRVERVETDRDSTCSTRSTRLDTDASSATLPLCDSAIKYALVGDHVTALPEESMRECPVDYVLTGGDWDFLLKNLVESGGAPSRFEPGIWYREQVEHSSIRAIEHSSVEACDSNAQTLKRSDALIRNTGRFQLNHDLNAAPWIDRDLVNWRLYAEKNGNFRRTPGTYIMAGRDCWHARCTFCSWTTLYPKYRTRDWKDVVDEIEMLVTKYGVREIMDDSGSFPVGPWLTNFCNEMIRRGLPRKVRLDCNMRFGRLTFDDYALMRRAGFRLVLFGVESANQSTLDRFVKALKVEDVEKGAAWAAKAGLDVHLTFMFGHAWEGKEDMARTVALARRLLANGHASTLQCTMTIPYPGTPLFRELKEKDGLTTLDWDEYDMRRQITKTPLVTEDEIKCAIREVYKGFLQPRALWHRFTTTRTLFDFSFYYRGLRSLLGHLLDFRSRH